VAHSHGHRYEYRRATPSSENATSFRSRLAWSGHVIADLLANSRDPAADHLAKAYG